MKKNKVINKVLTIVGFVLCIIFAFLLICNLVIIIKGSLKPETPPSVFGTTPMVVTSGSMSGTAKDHIEVNDLIFVRHCKAEELKVGDVICFMEGKITVTHRITSILNEEDGTRSFRTKGDANNTEDRNSVPQKNVVGIYRFRIPKVGGFALFLQKPVGMIIFIGIPLLAFFIYDFLRRKKESNEDEKKTEELQAEIRRLKKLAEEKEQAKGGEGDSEEVSENLDSV